MRHATLHRLRHASVTRVLLFGAAVLAAGVVLDGCRQPPAEPRVVAARTVIYHCPMHPEYTSDKPGSCPICGMTLVPIEGASPPEAHGGRPDPSSGGPPAGGTGGDAAGRTIALGTDRARLAGVRTVTVESGSLAPGIRAVGTVAIDETRVRQVTTKVGGFVERLYVNATGQMVRSGEPLFSLYSPELLASQEEFLRARASAAVFERSDLPEVRKGGADLAASARRRLELFDVPPEFIERLLQSNHVERTVEFKAPFAGFVTGKRIVAGQRVEPGMDLLTVSDLSQVWVLAQVYEAEARLAQPGRMARITLPFDPAAAQSGRVEFVYPTLDTESRTLTVRFVLANPRGVLRPGMSVTVELRGAPERGAVVPDSAIIDSGARQVVFVETAPGQFASREVTVSARADGRAVVRTGLSAGEKVAVSANFLLDSESRLRSATTR